MTAADIDGTRSVRYVQFSIGNLAATVCGLDHSFDANVRGFITLKRGYKVTWFNAPREHVVGLIEELKALAIPSGWDTSAGERKACERAAVRVAKALKHCDHGWAHVERHRAEGEDARNASDEAREAAERAKMLKQAEEIGRKAWTDLILLVGSDWCGLFDEAREAFARGYGYGSVDDEQ